jgi:hypothetical protein
MVVLTWLMCRSVTVLTFTNVTDIGDSFYFSSVCTFYYLTVFFDKDLLAQTSEKNILTNPPIEPNEQRSISDQPSS